ncbi:hypothetical protein Krac_8900 [Ktedonobacter racemifer DSM 44963]|uniref:Uncharacterized protein n=1 Tax=Ktedonobacter racemifer DSM 44963 TaxID=485913 RepID=D6TPX9_KTERA|nr:hypothetical protein Krac_8900 [Ktedonobacter racemifer DSM 44963]
MDELWVELIFDKELPCSVCGTPTNCGLAYRSETQGITGRFSETWILNPYCEQRTGCRDKIWEEVVRIQRLD